MGQLEQTPRFAARSFARRSFAPNSVLFCARILFLCILLGAMRPALADSPASAKPPQTTPNTTQVVLTPALQPDAVFEVRGLSKDALGKLKALKKDDPRWKTLFEVKVHSVVSADLPAMLGTYRLILSGEGGVLQFKPRFPLQRGLKYQTKLDPSILSPPQTQNKLQGKLQPQAKPLVQTFAIPKLPKHKAAHIEAVYPSSPDLPENLLKFYLQFSAPMSIGDSYRYIHLRDESGKAVELPFLELPQELWNADGTRLTLLLDPGRIKRGLKPREDSGPVLVSGHKYILVIDRAWPDAKGQVLSTGFEKKFRATAPDKTQPDPKTWRLAVPKAKSTQALTVKFREALDHAMLQHVIRVLRADGTLVAGTINISDKETRWRFTPDNPWQAGEYRLAIATVLEDRSGNSIGRPFEVDLKNKSAPAPKNSKTQKAPKTTFVRFTIEKAEK